MAVRSWTGEQIASEKRRNPWTRALVRVPDRFGTADTGDGIPTLMRVETRLSTPTSGTGLTTRTVEDMKPKEA
jgi:hypothetical protein